MDLGLTEETTLPKPDTSASAVDPELVGRLLRYHADSELEHIELWA